MVNNSKQRYRWSTIPAISTKRTINSRPNLLNITKEKSTRYVVVNPGMGQTQKRDGYRHKNVAALNQLMIYKKSCLQYTCYDYTTATKSYGIVNVYCPVTSDFRLLDCILPKQILQV